MKLDCRTRGGVTPQGKPRVYYTGHPADQPVFFESTAADLFATQNCALYYDAEPDAPCDREELLHELEQMQLFVIPVTSRFLFQPNRARDVEFPFAMEQHIPVLPLMQEHGLEGAFNQVCGNLQMLNKRDPDRTALPYAQKLEKFLSSVLVGDELAEKVRGAFDAYVFLSYRKKDRRYAQELMRLIHRNDFCRDIAIWYDEFLTPGEDFNAAIADALEKCQLFALTVTPSIVEPDNYVMTTEYPEAKKAGKPILPVVMAHTSRWALGKNFKDLPRCAKGNSERGLSRALLDALHSVALRENDGDLEHNFFIGLAYLNGIDVEVDRARALALITGAAEAGLPEAMEQLVNMYRSGDGAARDHYAAIHWQTRLVNYWTEAAQRGAPGVLLELLPAMLMLGALYEEADELDSARIMYQSLHDTCKIELTNEALEDDHLRQWILSTYITTFSLTASVDDKQGRTGDAEANYRQCLELARKLWTEKRAARALGLMANAYNRLGHIARDQGRLDQAEHCYRQLMEVVQEQCRQDPNADAREDQAFSWSGLGKVYEAEGRLDQALDCYTRALELARQRLEETRSASARRSVIIDCQELGGLYRKMGQLDQAGAYFREMQALAQQLYDEEGTPDALHILGLSYERLSKICDDRGQPEQAKEYLSKSLELDQMRFDAIPTIEAKSSLASTLLQLGDLCRQLGQSEEADGSYQKSLALRQELAEQTRAPLEQFHLSTCYERLGDICRDRGRLNDGKARYMQALALREELSRASQDLDANMSVAISCNKIGLTLEDMDEDGQAEDYFRRALDIFRQLCAQSPTAELRRRMAANCRKLGSMAADRGQLDEAEPCLQESHAICSALYEETHAVADARELAGTCCDLGAARRDARRFDEGRAYYQQGLDLRTRIYEETGTIRDQRSLAIACNSFAVFSAEADCLDDAKTYYARSIELAKAVYRRSGKPDDRNDIALAAANLAELEEAPARRALLTQALDIWSELAGQCPEVAAYACRRDKARARLGETG